MKEFNLNEEQLKGFQKAVKYCALALAVALSASIIFGILSVVGTIFGFGAENSVGDMRDYEISGDFSDLDIEISAAVLKVSVGDTFSIKSNIKKLEVYVKDGRLNVKEDFKPQIFGQNYTDAVLEIAFPRDFTFGSVEIETGAGVVEIERLSASELTMALGAGKVTIKELTASASVDIDGGAGELNILGGTLKDLDFDMGVGEFNLRSKLLGSCDLDMGVGEANLTLIGTPDDYKIDFSTGLGSVRYNGDDVENGQIIGNGDTKIDIDGGVGAVNVKTENPS